MWREPHTDRLASPVDRLSRCCTGETWGIDSSVLLHSSLVGRQNARALVLVGDKAPNRVLATYMRALAAMMQHGARHTVHTESKAHVKATTESYMRLPVLPVPRNVGPEPRP